MNDESSSFAASTLGILLSIAIAMAFLPKGQSKAAAHWLIEQVAVKHRQGIVSLRSLNHQMGL